MCKGSVYGCATGGLRRLLGDARRTSAPKLAHQAGDSFEPVWNLRRGINLILITALAAEYMYFTHWLTHASPLTQLITGA